MGKNSKSQLQKVNIKFLNDQIFEKKRWMLSENWWLIILKLIMEIKNVKYYSDSL